MNLPHYKLIYTLTFSSSSEFLQWPPKMISDQKEVLWGRGGTHYTDKMEYERVILLFFIQLCKYSVLLQLRFNKVMGGGTQTSLLFFWGLKVVVVDLILKS